MACALCFSPRIFQQGHHLAICSGGPCEPGPGVVAAYRIDQPMKRKIAPMNKS